MFLPPVTAICSYLLLHDVDGKSAKFSVQIDVFQLAVIKVSGGIHAKVKAFFL